MSRRAFLTEAKGRMNQELRGSAEAAVLPPVKGKNTVYLKNCS
jgi:hypothetical protein